MKVLVKVMTVSHPISPESVRSPPYAPGSSLSSHSSPNARKQNSESDSLLNNSIRAFKLKLPAPDIAIAEMEIAIAMIAFFCWARNTLLARKVHTLRSQRSNFKASSTLLRSQVGTVALATLVLSMLSQSLDIALAIPVSEINSLLPLLQISSVLLSFDAFPLKGPKSMIYLKIGTKASNSKCNSEKPIKTISKVGI